VARFYLFRTLVFQRPVHLPELMQNPLQVLEMSELHGIEPLGDLEDVVDPEDPDQPDQPRGVGESVRDDSTDRSRSGPAPRPAP
jgi:hypothetical protein